jgi:hypothetical protein
VFGAWCEYRINDLMSTLGNTYYIRNMQDYEARMFFVQGRLMNEDDLEFYRNKMMGLDESPGRSRQVHSDEIGMSGGPRRRKSPSRGMNSSSPTKRIAGTSKPAASTSTARRR